jgi:hypothetical protein
MRFRGLWLGLVLVAGVVTARDAGAVGTRTFELDAIEELSGGDLAGVSVGSDGVVRAGWTLGNVPLPDDAGTTVTCAAELPDGSVLVGTGPASGGKIVRVVNDRATVFADTKESAVVALVVDKKGAAYAATTGNKIYRVTQGHADVFATLPDVDTVFAIAFDPSGAGLYAATGPDGRVLRVDTKGASSTYFKTDSPFVVSLAVADDGVVYAGTSGKGLLYRITAPGRATVLYDFHAEEVHAIALGPRRAVWAIVNETSGGAPSEPAEPPASRRNAGGRNPPGPSPAARGKPGKGSLWRFDADGHPERLMHHDDTHYTSLALDAHGAPYVGTGADGRIYTVDDTHVVSLLADTDERQIGAIGVAGRSRYHRVISVGGPDAIWTSRPLDAGLRARFGRAGWIGSGLLEVSTRTGDTQTPDTTWSPWSNAVANGDAIGSPAGRFVQMRARLRDATATISDITLAFVTENLRAIVTEISAHPKAGSSRDSKEGIVQSGSEPPKHDNVLHVAWKVDNPDSDELRYRVQFRRDSGQRWVDATRPDDVLTKPELDWDTAALEEGRYRLRVEATDEISNPPGSVTRHTLESAPVPIDNTPPVVRTLTVQGRRLRAEVVDGLGPIARIDVAVDGKPEWRPIAPADGIFDSATETVDMDLTSLLPPGPGAHLIALRAYDAAGNFVVRETESP